MNGINYFIDTDDWVTTNVLHFCWQFARNFYNNGYGANQHVRRRDTYAHSIQVLLCEYRMDWRFGRYHPTRMSQCRQIFNYQRKNYGVRINLNRTNCGFFFWNCMPNIHLFTRIEGIYTRGTYLHGFIYYWPQPFIGNYINKNPATFTVIHPVDLGVTAVSVISI